MSLLTKFDKKLYAKSIYRNGINDGEQTYLISQVCTKRAKGQSIFKIAEDLVEDEVLVENICRTAESFAPKYDAYAIFKQMSTKLD